MTNHLLTITSLSGSGGGGVTPPPTGVFEFYPHYDEVLSRPVVGAWGLRRLVSTYTGPLVRIRDSNDDTEQDVGIDADGLLDSFTVVGTPYIVRIYDQSGNGNDVYNASATSQPILTLDGYSGRPSARFDGSNDWLADQNYRTDAEYMVTYPMVILKAATDGTSENYGCFAAVPHTTGHSSPYYRWSYIRNNNASSIETRLCGSSQWVGTYTPELNGAASMGMTILSPHTGLAYTGRANHDLPGNAPTDITYPNNTGFRLGSTGSGTENADMEFHELVIADEQTATTEAEVQGYYDELSNVHVAAPSGVVLNLPLTSDTADSSPQGTPAWLSNGAAIAGGGLDPQATGTTGSLIVERGANTMIQDGTVIEFDIYLNSYQTEGRVMDCLLNVGTPLGGFIISTHDADSDEIMVISNNPSSAPAYIVTGFGGAAANLSLSTWHTVRVEFHSGTETEIYVDDALCASKIITLPVDNNVPITVGNGRTKGNPFPGLIRNITFTQP